MSNFTIHFFDPDSEKLRYTSTAHVTSKPDETFLRGARRYVDITYEATWLNRGTKAEAMAEILGDVPQLPRGEKFGVRVPAGIDEAEWRPRIEEATAKVGAILVAWNTEERYPLDA
jgi:hypothetical protein